MSADQETVTADQPNIFPGTRDATLRTWEEFLPRIPAYDAERNGVRPGHRSVSRLSPAIRQRLVTEYELIASTLAAHPFARVEKFVQEILWRRYWKSWLELRPSVWTDYRADAARLRGELRGYQARRIAELEEGRSGVEIMDYFAHELRTTGYLHNHARMWFAGFWIHTEKLPWELGADFFYRHLLDADPASNTLSWRWVAGIQTVGKPYLTRRSNLERYVAPDLLAAHEGGLEMLEDKLAQPARVDALELPRPEEPEDADDTMLPDDLPAQTGLWIHGDDLCVETAASGGDPAKWSLVFQGVPWLELGAGGRRLSGQPQWRAAIPRLAGDYLLRSLLRELGRSSVDTRCLSPLAGGLRWTWGRDVHLLGLDRRAGRAAGRRLVCRPGGVASATGPRRRSP